MMEVKNFALWIDGSFASLKANPGDMDLVFLIDHQQYQRNQAALAVLRRKFALLDIYFINSYPEDHPNYFLTNFDKLEWLHFFTRDRSNRKKGVLTLNVEG